MGNPGFWIFQKMIKKGFLGPKFSQIDEISTRMATNFIVTGCDYDRSFWTWQGLAAYMDPVNY